MKKRKTFTYSTRIEPDMNIFSYIKQHVSILEVVQEYATLKKAGLYWKGHCPFHHEKTASFTVSPHKEIFYCFGCHIGGDVITFITKIEQCSSFDAAKYIAQRYQIKLPEELDSKEAKNSARQKNQYNNICKKVSEWCYTQLLKNPTLLQYLKKRGFNLSSITYFSLGYFPGGLHAIKSLIHNMKEQHILVNDLLDAQILCAGKTVLYSPFEERLIFPIKNHLGNYCGFGGRVFKQHDVRSKYYNSRENSYFIKGNLLFGLDLAKKTIQETGIVFLVEGYTDCIAMAQHGFINSVATLGTACTIHHLKLLGKYANQLYILYDEDNAGKEAILRLAKLCWQANMELKVISLPAREDPASFFMNNDKDDLQLYINRAQDIFFFLLDSLGNNFATKSLNDKLQTIRSFLQTLSTINDNLKQDLLLQKSSTTFNIPFESLKSELISMKNQQKKTDKNTLNPSFKKPFQPINPISDLEKKIFYAIINNVALIDKGNEQYLIDHLPPPLNNILKQLKAAKQVGTSFKFSLFFDQLNDDQKQWLSQLLLTQEEKINVIAFKQLYLQWQKKQWKIVVQNVKMKLLHAKKQDDKLKMQEILTNFSKLKPKIISLFNEKNNKLTKGD